jgi:hypothetical protein
MAKPGIFAGNAARLVISGGTKVESAGKTAKGPAFPPGLMNP